MIASVVKDWEEFPEIRGTQIELSPDDLHWLENNFASLQLCIKLDNVRKGSELDMLIYIGQTLDFNSTLAACKRRLAGQENHPVRAGTINDGPPLPPLLTPVSSSQIPEDFKCAICRTDIGPEANGIPVKTPCNHFTHHDCISRWVNNFSATCPLCRAAFSTENYTLPEVVEVEIEYQAVPWLRGLMDTYLGLEKVNNTV
ncbi:hypothetical protein BJ875DRAFT_450754 [Amylocarpus encephaloides]|uniref:RING-type domain-containing protein n=1 Tax=Amylocarpus encephaloides TaxID=45428 RepID=A0A9P8C9M3_9HELO|nr:hypothetical protein BJ875DRAFT_450754 [Amylocarpus encephaloides]